MKKQKNNNVKWLYKLRQDDEKTFLIPISEIDIIIPGVYYFSNDWFLIEINQNFVEIRIRKNYSWDGCTPKFVVWDILFGTPDGAVDKLTERPKCYYPSLVHDVLCQFKKDIRLTQKQIDQIFLYLMKEYNFSPAKLYYRAVRIFDLKRRLF